MLKLRFIYALIIQLVFGVCLSAQTDFSASITEGCTPMQVKFSIDESTVNMDTISRIDWHFGIGDSVTSLDPDTVIFGEEGIFTVAMVVNGFTEAAIVKTDLITVHRTLSAAFEYEEYAPNNNFRFIPADVITDLTATYFYMWRYNKKDSSDSRGNDRIVTYADQLNAIDSVTLDTGVYTVTLRVEDTYGCLSRFSREITIAEEIRVPNIFLPNVEEFLIIDSQNPETVLKFQVFNRNGLLVFSQLAPVINWNGKTNNGTFLTTGIYFYILEAIQGDTVGRFSQQGFIHLYR